MTSDILTLNSESSLIARRIDAMMKPINTTAMTMKIIATGTMGTLDEQRRFSDSVDHH